jgi:hypothetical protein
MLDLQNYLKGKLFLKYSREVHGRSVLQISTDFEHLKVLLLGAGSKSFGSVPTFNISLFDFLFQKIENGKDQVEVQSILKTNQRFLLWGKAMFPVEFQSIRLDRIMEITTIPERKEVII